MKCRVIFRPAAVADMDRARNSFSSEEGFATARFEADVNPVYAVELRREG